MVFSGTLSHHLVTSHCDFTRFSKCHTIQKHHAAWITCSSWEPTISRHSRIDYITVSYAGVNVVLLTYLRYSIMKKLVRGTESSQTDEINSDLEWNWHWINKFIFYFKSDTKWFWLLMNLNVFFSKALTITTIIPIVPFPWIIHAFYFKFHSQKLITTCFTKSWIKIFEY